MSYSTSLDYLFKTLAYYDDIRLNPYDTVTVDFEMARVYTGIGLNYFALGNHTKALEYYENGLSLIEKLNLNSSAPNMDRSLFITTFNIGTVYVDLKESEKAKYYFDKALEYNQLIGNKEFDASIYNNLGILYKEEKDYETAFEYYLRSEQIRKTLNDTIILAQTYCNMGELELLRGRYKPAREYLTLSYNYSTTIGSVKGEMLSALFLSSVHEKLGNYKESLEMYRHYKELNDSTLSAEQLKLTAGNELLYKHERQIKEMELAQQLELSKKERKSLIYLVSTIILLLSLIILNLINRNQRFKIKQGSLLQERMELEQKNLQLENQNLGLELEMRNKELTTNVMYLINKNELLYTITEKLSTIKHNLLPENRTPVQEIIHELEKNIDNTVWEEFEVRFENVQEDFYRKLHKTYPNLTPNEIKLCAFLRLNMTTKEISSITLQSVRSIEMARTRLRRKMGITREQNIVTLLQNL